jgi:hypothetical protein
MSEIKTPKELDGGPDIYFNCSADGGVKAENP